MGLMDQAKKLLNKEETTDKILDKAEELATKKFGEDKADHIKKVREVVDNKLGDNRAAGNEADGAHSTNDEPEAK